MSAAVSDSRMRRLTLLKKRAASSVGSVSIFVDRRAPHEVGISGADGVGSAGSAAFTPVTIIANPARSSRSRRCRATSSFNALFSSSTTLPSVRRRLRGAPAVAMLTVPVWPPSMDTPFERRCLTISLTAVTRSFSVRVAPPPSSEKQVAVGMHPAAEIEVGAGEEAQIDGGEHAELEHGNGDGLEPPGQVHFTADRGARRALHVVDRLERQQAGPRRRTGRDDPRATAPARSACIRMCRRPPGR